MLKLDQSLKHTIDTTAFLVNQSRNLSVFNQDSYSKLWIPKEIMDDVEDLWQRYSEQVYPYDHYELGIRTSFILQQLKDFTSQNKDLNPIFVNIGSGFTSYQYLLGDDTLAVEVDLENVIDFKSERTKELVKSHCLPNRSTVFLKCDLESQDSRVNLFKELQKIIINQPSFFLLEGITYYLSEISMRDLFYEIAILQEPENSLLVFDFWDEGLIKDPIYQRMADFYFDEFSFDVENLNLLPNSYLKSLYGYENILQTDAFQELKTQGAVKIDLTRKNALKENYAVLKRINSKTVNKH